MKKVFTAVALFALLLTLTACSLPIVSRWRTSEETSTPATNVAPGQVAVMNSDVIVTSPLSSNTVASPLTVEGRTRLKSGVIFLVMKDAVNQVMATSSIAIADSIEEWSPYRGTIAFPTPFSQNGWLEVYTIRSQEEGVRDLVRLPVAFQDFKSPIVKVYFQNSEGDPNFTDCSIVYPVERTVTVTDQSNLASQLVDAALSNLLAGPTEADKNNGFISQLPAEGVVVQKIEVTKDPAGKNIFRVDFNQSLQQGVAGSCRVTGIRAQITQTLKQFAGVDDVVISIDGKTDEILQP